MYAVGLPQAMANRMDAGDLACQMGAGSLACFRTRQSNRSQTAQKATPADGKDANEAILGASAYGQLKLSSTPL